MSREAYDVVAIQSGTDWTLGPAALITAKIGCLSDTADNTATASFAAPELWSDNGDCRDTGTQGTICLSYGVGTVVDDSPAVA